MPGKKSIIIDINHPSQVHIFRPFYFEMKDKYNLFVTTKHIPIVIQLLDLYKIPYITFGKYSDSILGKAFLRLEWINFFDRNNGPIFSNNLPPRADDMFNLNILNREKKIIINRNCKKYLIIFIFV